MITEDDKLIAEFMGLSIKECVCYYTDEDDLFPMGVEVEGPFLPYDTDWNWLMEVLDKIAFIIYSNDTGFEVEEDWHLITDAIPDIDFTYKKAVNYIKQYNIRK